MRLLADENMSASVIAALRDRGFDVLSARESLAGDDDETVLAALKPIPELSSPSTRILANSRFASACPPPAASFYSD
jgi:hypothetical protein